MISLWPAPQELAWTGDEAPASAPVRHRGRAVAAGRGLHARRFGPRRRDYARGRERASLRRGDPRAAHAPRRLASRRAHPRLARLPRSGLDAGRQSRSRPHARDAAALARRDGGGAPQSASALHRARLRVSGSPGGLAGRVSDHARRRRLAGRGVSRARDRARPQSQHLRSHGALARPRSLPVSRRGARRLAWPDGPASGAGRARAHARERGVRALAGSRDAGCVLEPAHPHRLRRDLRAGPRRESIFRRISWKVEGLPRSPEADSRAAPARGRGGAVLGRHPAQRPGARRRAAGRAGRGAGVALRGALRGRGAAARVCVRRCPASERPTPMRAAS